MLTAREAPLTLLRVVTAALLIAHGAARVGLGIVDDFGLFLESRGFPFALALAWVITLVELTGGVSLAFGRATRPLCAWFIAQLLVGIALVHAREGWFVVGAGRNGVEYSVLLIAALLTIGWGSKRS